MGPLAASHHHAHTDPLPPSASPSASELQCARRGFLACPPACAPDCPSPSCLPAVRRACVASITTQLASRPNLHPSPYPTPRAPAPPLPLLFIRPRSRAFTSLLFHLNHRMLFLASSFAPEAPQTILLLGGRGASRGPAHQCAARSDSNPNRTGLRQEGSCVCPVQYQGAGSINRPSHLPSGGEHYPPPAAQSFFCFG